MSRSGIYSLTCVVSRKRYIGSAVNLDARFRKHRRLLRQGDHPNTHLQSAWERYGESSFSFDVLELAESAILLDREAYWINFYQSHLRECGFNKRKIPNSNLGLVFDEASRMRQSESAKQYNADPSVRARKSQQMKRYNADPSVKSRKSAEMQRRLQDDPGALDAMHQGYADLRKDPGRWSARNQKLSQINSTPEARLAQSERSKAAWQKPGVREKRAETTSKTWSDQEVRKRRIDGIRRVQATDEYKLRHAAAVKAAKNRPEARLQNSLRQRQWFRITSPDGEVLEVHGLKPFCKDNGLDFGSMISIATGKKTSPYKGWWCQRLERQEVLNDASN